ncbi:hypothetical protein [Roseivirga pacifica]|uniref:hypothetical protein n=1 Tax=Roseivirga pacifica TaxID=1267423 RepID=UPI001113DE9B|nr:hypothetical protein [Roseivirga pacifica]
MRYEQIQLPKWINSLDSEEVNICLKVSLKEINESDGYHPKKWLEELCTKLEGQTKQSLPPALLTKGFVLMLVILAVRSKAVQKDKADFYQGIPSDLSTIIYKSSNLLRRDLYTPV